MGGILIRCYYYCRLFYFWVLKEVELFFYKIKLFCVCKIKYFNFSILFKMFLFKYVVEFVSLE